MSLFCFTLYSEFAWLFLTPFDPCVLSALASVESSLFVTLLVPLGGYLSTLCSLITAPHIALRCVIQNAYRGTISDANSRPTPSSLGYCQSTSNGIRLAKNRLEMRLSHGIVVEKNHKTFGHGEELVIATRSLKSARTRLFLSLSLFVINWCAAYSII